MTEILDGVSDLVQSVCPDGRIRYVNRAWLERLGYSGREVEGLNIFSVIHPESHEHCMHYFQRLLAGEDVGLMEVTFCTKSGERVQFEGRVSVQFENGTPTSTAGVFRELTTPRRAEATLARLREQRKLFQSVLSLLRATEALDRDSFFAVVTAKVSAVLSVARASIWLLDETHESIICESLHADGVARGKVDIELSRTQFLPYFEAIESRLPVRADDACTHPATSCFTENYLKPLGITSMLDGPIRLGESLAGVICCEHTGPMRHWTNDEEEFLLAVSAIVLTFLETERRVEAESRLLATNLALEATVDERTREARRSERRLQYLITSSPAVIYTCEPVLPFRGTYVSPNIEGMLGYPAENYLSHPTFWSDRIHPEDAPQAYSTLREAVEHGRSSYEYRFRHADGNYRWLRDSFVLIRDADGNPREIVGSCVDIHDRRRAENEARAAASDLSRLIDTANAPIFGKDTSGHVNEWNRSAERLTGFSKQEVLGRDLVDFVSPGFKLAVKEVLDRALSGTETANFEFPLMTKDGREVTVLLNASTRRDAAGAITGMVGVGQDITGLRDADQRSLRAKRLESLGTLAGGVAHDINNALAPIMLACGLLRKEAPHCSRLVDILESSSRRGASMVQQLLTFAKGVDGERTALDARRILGELQQIVGSTFPKNIRLRFAADDGLPNVIGDPTQIHQVLLNLCVNARDAMQGGGAITVSVSAAEIDDREAAAHADCLRGRYLRWTISDTGSGIPEAVLERIFEPFFSTKSPDQGTGLGLSTALGIVRSHGGFMRVASSPGHGSIFSVYLPEAPQQSATPSKLAPTQPPRGDGQTILIVDDEPAVREVLKQIAIALGYRVRTAQDGAAALAVLGDPSITVDGVITDLHMPNMDGLELARRIAAVRPGLGVVLSSGRIDVQDMTGHGDPTFRGSLEKPFTIERLAQALRELLSSSSRPGLTLTGSAGREREQP
ncbi:MAG: PAS domain S-box protein [bacterium]